MSVSMILSPLLPPAAAYDLEPDDHAGLPHEQLVPVYHMGNDTISR